MNPKSTRYLVLLALGLFAFIIFYERDRSGRSSDTAASEVFPAFNGDSVTGLEFVLQTGLTNQLLRFERTNGTWRMTLPVFYPVNSASVDLFLAGLASLRKKLSISAQELLTQPRGMAAFGLDPPVALVAVHQGPKKSELRLGNRAPMGDLFYFQVLGLQEIYISDANFLRTLPRSANDWRSRSLIDLAGFTFDRFEVRSGAIGFEAQRQASNGLWQLAKPLAIRANHSKIESRLQMFQGFQVEEFVATGGVVDLERYGLQPPRLELAFGRGTNDLLTLRFGGTPTNQPDMIYARLSSLSNVVTVHRQALNLIGTSYAEFLDPRLISFPTGSVERVEIRAAEPFVLQRQTDGVWRVSGPMDFVADPALVSEFFNRLLRLEIIEIEKDVVTELDFPNYGFTSNAPQYTVLVAVTNQAGALTNTIRAQIEFGSNQVDRVLVRRSGDTPVFKTRLADALGLPRFAFEFRDRRVWSFTTNQVTGLTINVKGQTRKFGRGPDGTWTFVAGGPGPIPFALEEAAHRLGELQVESWIARGRDRLPLFAFADFNHSLTIDLTVDGKPRTFTIAFGARSVKLSPYGAVTMPGDSEPTVFQLAYWFYAPYQSVLSELKLAEAAGTP